MLNTKNRVTRRIAFCISNDPFFFIYDMVRDA